MKRDKKILKSASILTGAALTTSLTAFAAANTDAEIPQHTSMGSGAEVRSEIMNLNAPDIINHETSYKFGELKCGEGEGEGEKAKKKKSKGEKGEKAEGKTSEAKCGEGKCGEGEGEKKAKKEKEAKESKSSEAKCGEGKCG
jgi:hypothetical protein